MLPKLRMSSIRFQNGSSSLVWFTSHVKIWRNAEDLHPIRTESDMSASNRSRHACPVHDPWFGIHELGIGTEVPATFFPKKEIAKGAGRGGHAPQALDRGSIRFRNSSSTLVWFTPLRLVGMEGFAPTQHKAPGLQSGSALSLRSTPFTHVMLRKLVASPGNAPGHRGYEPQVRTSWLAIFRSIWLKPTHSYPARNRALCA